VTRISLLVGIAPHSDITHGVLSISEAESAEVLAVEPNLFMLTLEREPGATYARGEFRSLHTQARYPIQGNAALFEALSEYVAGHRPTS